MQYIDYPLFRRLAHMEWRFYEKVDGHFRLVLVAAMMSFGNRLRLRDGLIHKARSTKEFCHVIFIRCPFDKW